LKAILAKLATGEAAFEAAPRLKPNFRSFE